ncbi:hypothetical protein MBLNU13_g04929t2 [Cladosporium sp. NU13]
MIAGTQDAVPNYFRHPHYVGWMYAHIAFMIASWVITLPPALMLSVARSKHHLPAQLVFHSINGLGMFTGFVYNHSTPNLYTNNAHHSIGWVVTSLTVLWTLLSLVVAYTNGQKKNEHPRAASRTSSQDRVEDASFEDYMDSPTTYRYSRDSGNFSGGSRSNSSDSIFEKDETIPLQDDQDRTNFETQDVTKSSGFLRGKKLNGTFARAARLASHTRILAILRISQIILEKFLLLLGFLAVTSGFIVYGGLFKDREVYSGLAHYVKGGIFFWYGLLTLGRWMGAFAEFGWAWNVRPQRAQVSKWKSRVPSAEFTESFVIWLYGASNVFLEHLNNWGKAWSPQDFEHVSITILFFGGGLLGMMIESRALQNLASVPAQAQKSSLQELETDDSGFKFVSGNFVHSNQHSTPSNKKRLSLNPMPALTILFLGMMMSGHHQSSMVSTMLHAQWGMLFTGFAMARAVTYIMLYLKPPTSHYPSRPPSELVAAFCLTAGGILFMNSARDVVVTIESNSLDAMTIFTLTIGLTGVILAWELVCYTIKVWAARSEQRLSRI